MSRTKGSGWGAGTILYQVCPLCQKKKAYYDYNEYHSFRCSSCKEHFDSLTLIKFKYVSQLKRMDKKVQKFRVEEHLVCAKCGACHFSDKEACIECFDSHTEDKNES